MSVIHESIEEIVLSQDYLLETQKRKLIEALEKVNPNSVYLELEDLTDFLAYMLNLTPLDLDSEDRIKIKDWMRQNGFSC